LEIRYAQAAVSVSSWEPVEHLLHAKGQFEGVGPCCDVVPFINFK
jgi:hypothetical protein